MARKILLADDSVTAQNMGRKILADAGYDVITVNNGSAALKRVTDSKPDLIVLDVYMPGYSGLEVCQRIKDAPETAHIPVLLTVGKLEPFKPDEARRARADAHIVKPFEASELLSAIARLEDRIVPTTNGARFSAPVSGVERFGEERAKAVPAESDTGWKSRLRFPSRKKKEEPDADDDSVSSFRDFRKSKGKPAGNDPPAASSTPPPGQEPGLVPSIPRDITPEELDVLSALAAKLDGPIPEAENIASLAEHVGPPQPSEPASTQTANAVDAGVGAASEPAPHAASEPVKEFEVPAEAVAAAAAITARVISATSEQNGSASEAASDTQPATPENSLDPGNGNFAAFTVNPAALAESAPIDQSDEPIFAVVPAVSSEARTVEPNLADAVPSESASAAPQMTTESQAPEMSGSPAADLASPSAPETSEQEHGTLDHAASEPCEPPMPRAVSAAPAETETAEAPAPTDEELAEALRLLTPATANADVAMPSHSTLVAAGQMLAEEAARTASPGTHWVAEAVALSQEETSTSLEDEMFRTFSSAAATKTESAETISSPLPESASTYTTPESEASVASAGTPVPEPEPAVVSNATSQIASTTNSNSTVYATELGETEKNQTPIDEPSEEPVHGTFADATLQAEESVDGSKHVESAQEVTANAGADENSSSDLGGDHDMAKHGKENSSKSGWHQIRKPAASSAATDPVETAKQSASDATEDSKAMAAAATADGGSSAPDASAIASIVDSVLADLRPKIVEEIAKKLGKK